MFISPHSTHDTAGAGVASQLAAAEAGADVVDAAMDAMSGMTSQPSLGALIANVRGTDISTAFDMANIGPLNNYWENVRQMYAPFESGQLSGSSDVYFHEIPGGQYTNLLFQSRQLGLTDRWPQIKQKYAEANWILGDIPKVTPSSKVVGDLAQFMVAQNLEMKVVVDQADTLAFPESVVQYLRGEIGVPPGGFPEPLRSKVLKSRGLEPIEGRPGASLDDYNFEEAEELLKSKYGEVITYKDVLSHALYPNVFIDWKNFEAVYGQVGDLPTHLFLNPLVEGDEVMFPFSEGRDVILKLVSLGQAVGLKVEVGDEVREGEPVATLSAMKMETNIPATASGKITNIMVNIGDKLEGDDLIMKIE